MSVQVVEPSAAVLRGRRRLLVGVALVATLLLLIGADKLWRTHQDRAPYGPEAVHPTAALTIVTAGEATTLISRAAPTSGLGGQYVGGADTIRNNIFGRVTLAVPAKAQHVDGSYVLFVIDRATGRSVSRINGAANGSDLTPGWDSRYNQIGTRYPSLSGIGSWDPNQIFGAPGTALDVPTGGAGSVVFTAALAATAPADEQARDAVSVVLAFFGPGELLYWATSVRSLLLVEATAKSNVNALGPRLVTETVGGVV